MERPFRIAYLEKSLTATDGFVNDHDYIARCRPADIRDTLKYVDKLEADIEGLRALLRRVNVVACNPAKGQEDSQLWIDVNFALKQEGDDDTGK